MNFQSTQCRCLRSATGSSVSPASESAGVDTDRIKLTVFHRRAKVRGLRRLPRGGWRSNCRSSASRYGLTEVSVNCRKPRRGVYVCLVRFRGHGACRIQGSRRLPPPAHPRRSPDPPSVELMRGPTALSCWPALGARRCRVEQVEHDRRTARRRGGRGLRPPGGSPVMSGLRGGLGGRRALLGRPRAQGSGQGSGGVSVPLRPSPSTFLLSLLVENF